MKDVPRLAIMCAFAVMLPCAPMVSAQSLLQREPTVTIGVLDGSDEYVFAWIGDLDVDVRGNDLKRHGRHGVVERTLSRGGR